jgi:hypothetical protein
MFLRTFVRFSLRSIWLLTSVWSVCWSQQIISLQGRVLQKDPRLPLAGANVYLNNTTLGSSSAADGSFQIKSIPPGFYHLVVSLIGYQTLVKPLTMTANDSEPLDILLEPKELILNDVTVTSSIDKKWKKLYKILESVLLGPQDDSEIKTWEENRRRAYFGSLRHFLMCFFDGKWVQENFVVFYGQVTNYFNAWHQNRLIGQNATDIFWKAEAGDSSFKTFASPAYYSVFYLGPNSEPVNDIKDLKHCNPLYQSGFQLDQPYVVIDRNGRLDDPMAISLFGHWADQRLADALPVDYTPD